MSSVGRTEQSESLSILFQRIVSTDQARTDSSAEAPLVSRDFPYELKLTVHIPCRHPTTTRSHAIEATGVTYQTIIVFVVRPARARRLSPATTHHFPFHSYVFRFCFHRLFSLLFTFPSQYLFSIGLPAIFSLRLSLQPIFALHSQTVRLFGACGSRAERRKISVPHGAITL